MSHYDFDIVIVGASVAGASAAINLAKTGASILIVDKDEFPRRKVCGEGLSANGLQMLAELGVNIASIPHVKLDGYEIISDSDVSKITMPSLAVHRGGAGVSRAHLDHALVQQAVKASNVRLLTGVSVRSLKQSEVGCLMGFEDGYHLFAKTVIVAAGARNSFSHWPVRSKSTFRYGSSRHYRASHQLDSTHVRILLGGTHEIYLTPTEGNLLNASVLSKKSDFADLITEDAQERSMSRFEQHLGVKLEPVDKLLVTGSLQMRRAMAAEGLIFYVGDACEQFDPVGGMGMTHAILSAKLVSEELTAALEDRIHFQDAASRYSRRQKQGAKSVRGFTRLTYLMLVSLGQTPTARYLRGSRLAQSASLAIHQANTELLTRISAQLLLLAGTL